VAPEAAPRETQRLRVGFAGTPEFARAALQQLLHCGYSPVLVLTQPDRPAGRGLKLQPSTVKQLALAHGLTLVQPRSLRLDGKFAEDAHAAQQAVQAARLDVLVVAAYGLILPQWLLSLPRLGCINIHGSLLPRWRGAAPVQRAIEAGDDVTGVCIMQMDAGLDTGDILRQETLAIDAGDTSASLSQRLAELGARLLLRTLDDLAAGAVDRRPQPAEGSCYANKIDKAEAPIDWHQDAAVIERRVRAFDPFPGASLQLGDESHKVWRAALRPGSAGHAGSVLASAPGTLLVACGRDALLLQELQRPGGRRQPVAAWLQSLPAGAVAPGVVLAAPAAGRLKL
jgi:methionyl-tRNA formyltransferase